MQPLATAQPGVVFTYPVDAQLDVPLGTRIVVTFSDPVDASALGACSGSGDSVSGAFCVVGPGGALDVTPKVSSDGKTVLVESPGFDPGAQYTVYVRPTLAPKAQNLPASGPLVTFTTRSERPKSAVPAVVAVNGAPPATPDAFRPMLDTGTIRLVFSEPLDPRSVRMAAGSVELVDATGAAVPATLLVHDIHVSIDPVSDLTGGATYTLKLGSQILDLGGQPLAPVQFTLAPKNTKGATPISQKLRTRKMGDPGSATPRTGTSTNTIDLDKPLIGKETATLSQAVLAAELGDPKAMDGPIAFTIRRGQRLRASGLDIKLGGAIPAGLSTGDIIIEFLTDGGGRLYRNPHQPADQRPENDRAPLYVDFALDVAVYSVDPTGNAVLAQTVLGLQAAGIVTATDGVLDIETAAAMDLGLLGITSAPSNLVLELITDPNATVDSDAAAPTLVGTFPEASSSELPIDAGIELIFSEPVNLDRLRAGGLTLATAAGQAVPFEIESDGSAVVVRPLARLAYSTTYRVTLSDVADIAGNKLAATGPLEFSTPKLNATGAPLTVVAAHPGAPCALTGATAGSPGRCDGGQNTDDTYQPFTLAANDVIKLSFSQPLTPATATLAASCTGGGTVRVEELDSGGNCVRSVPGTLLVRDRGLSFVPDANWTTGTKYRVVLHSGGNSTCDAGELCGIQDAASFDPLNGATGGAGGGADMVIAFTAAPASKDTFLLTTAAPFTDINGSGTVDGAELPRTENQAGMMITGTSGAVSAASFSGGDAMFLQGAMPVVMKELQMGCTLPGGQSAASCIPVVMSPQAMYGTSVTMNATAAGIAPITTSTNTSIMRLREPANGPIMAYIVDNGAMPKLVLALDIYMDAPDMSVPLCSHDLHSKPMSLNLEGPVTFQQDGRIAISVANTADVPVVVNLSCPLGITGQVKMKVPAGAMKLELVSPPVRGAL